MSDITNTPVPCTVLDENGETLELSIAEPADGQIAVIDSWIRASIVDTAYESMANLPEKVRSEAIAKVAEGAAEVTMFSERGESVLSTLDGFSFMVFKQAEKHTKPSVKLTYEKMRRLAEVAGNMEKISIARKLLAGANTSTEKPEAPSNKT